MDTVVKKQFAILLLRNANVSPDRINAQMIQLILTASISHSDAYSDKTQYIINLTEEEA